VLSEDALEVQSSEFAAMWQETFLAVQVLSDMLSRSHFDLCVIVQSLAAQGVACQAPQRYSKLHVMPIELSSIYFILPSVVLQADIEHITDQYAAVSSDPFGAIGLQPTTASRYESLT
jgi:hypothetical protein